MCCGCCGDSHADIEDLPFKGEGDGKVIDFRDKHGCCRDFYCLVIFAAAVAGMIIVFFRGFSQGDPRILYAPLDKEGGFCGLETNEENYTDKPDLHYIVYYNVSAPTQGICVEQCPKPDKYCVMDNGSVISKSMGDCLTDQHSEYYVGGFDQAEEEKIKELFLNFSVENALEALGLNINFVITDSIDLMNRCIPNIPAMLQNLEIYDGLNNVFTAAVSDVRQSWRLFLATVGLTLVLCLLAICCLQCCATCITWSLIVAGLLLVFIVGGVSLVYGIRKAQVDLQSDSTSAKIIMAFGGVLLGVGMVLLVITIALRSRISLAAALVEEASRAIKNNLCLVLVPVVYAILFIGGAVLMLVTMVYYFSSLKIDREGAVRSIVVVKQDRFIVLFVVLCFFWMAFFLLGLNQYTIAGAGAYFYFSRTSADRPYFPIARTLWTLILHHLGSVAVGSFLIALVATFRTVLLYVSKKAKEAQSEQLRCVIACVQCCMGCLQKILEFIASRAYIMMAIQGQNFWISAFDALKLMVENPLRTGIVTVISGFLIVMAEILVTALAVLAAFVALRPDVFVSSMKPFIRVIYWWFILFICAVIAFFVAWIVFQIYESLIDTIFFCFLYDEHMKKKEGGHYITYASDTLRGMMDVVDKHGLEDENESASSLLGRGNKSVKKYEVDY